MTTHSVLLPGKSHKQRSLAGYSPWGYKESDTTGQLSTHTHFIRGPISKYSHTRSPDFKI